MSVIQLPNASCIKRSPYNSDGAIRGGLYEMSEKEYRALPGLNWSTLKHVLDCPAMARYLQDNPVQQTAAMRLGSMVHMATLEPDQFDKTYAVRPEIEKSEWVFSRVEGGWCRHRKDGFEVEGPFKTKKDAMATAAIYNFPGGDGYTKLAEARTARGQYFSNFTFATQEEMDTAWAMADSVHRHPASKRLLDNSMTEFVALWYHESQTLGELFLCKAKIDAWDMTEQVICDLKTCQSSNPAVFVRNNVERYDLHAQLAWYQMGIRFAIEQDLGTDFEHFETSFIAVEKTPPYLVSYLVPTNDMMRIGEIHCQEAFETWVQCESEDRWPARSEEAVVIDISPWKLKEFENGLS